MAKKWQDLIDRMPRTRRDRIQRGANKMLREITLQELRKAFELTQQDVAATLDINQAAISKMEGQSDMQISTLRKLLAAMGGSLELVARFPDGDVVIELE
jgi:DNA-binding XRE family transcriptional regulator